MDVLAWDVSNNERKFIETIGRSGKHILLTAQNSDRPVKIKRPWFGAVIDTSPRVVLRV